MPIDKKGNKVLYVPFKYKGKGKFKFSVYVKSKTGGVKKISYGHKDYQDYRQHKDKKRRKAYLARAKGIKNKKGEFTWKDKNTKNYWAVHHLWAG